LDADVAGELIELGALMEFRMGIITKEIAIKIYHQAACPVMSSLAPAWASHGLECTWLN
jgi:hypothetical protein